MGIRLKNLRNQNGEGILGEKLKSSETLRVMEIKDKNNPNILIRVVEDRECYNLLLSSLENKDITDYIELDEGKVKKMMRVTFTGSGYNRDREFDEDNKLINQISKAICKEFKNLVKERSEDKEVKE